MNLFAKRIILKKLLRLAKNCIFPVNGKLLKKVVDCLMGGAISVVFSDAYMCKMEFDVLVLVNLLFIESFVGDTSVERKKTRYMLFEKVLFIKTSN